MKAIKTYIIPETNTKPRRIVATDGDGNKLTKTYGYNSNEHELTAYALCVKMNWEGRLIGGCYKGAYYWVFNY